MEETPEVPAVLVDFVFNEQHNDWLTAVLGESTMQEDMKMATYILYYAARLIRAMHDETYDDPRLADAHDLVRKVIDDIEDMINH